MLEAMNNITIVVGGELDRDHSGGYRDQFSNGVDQKDPVHPRCRRSSLK